MKYLNEDGLQVVADKINTRLKTVTEMPLTANDGAVRLYVGIDGTYLKGHIYKMVSNIYHMWRVSSRIVYTKGRTPSVGDIIYDWDGTVYTDSGYTVVEVDGTNYITSSNGMTYGDYGTQGEENWTDITAGSGTVDLNFNPVSENAQSGIAVSQALKQVVDENTELVWENKIWGGYNEFQGNCVWTDGVNIYSSEGTNQYILNKATSTWEQKTWNDMPESGFYAARHIWTDGDNIYLSQNDWDVKNQRVLNKTTSTWEEKTWYGLTEFAAEQIWTDGSNIYYSSNGSNYVLNKATSTWEPKTWNGLTNFDGAYIWTDGGNVYYSQYAEEYILNKSTSTWEPKTWNGYDYNKLYSDIIWTDGISVYISDFDNNSYILDRATSTWKPISWGNITINGYDIWKDSDTIYCTVQTGESDWVSYVCHREL